MTDAQLSPAVKSRFDELLADMERGLRPLLLVDAAAGLGKSHALAQLVALAQARGVQVRVAESERGVPVQEQLIAPAQPAAPAPTDHRTLLVVDDAHRADESSLSWLAEQLAHNPTSNLACALAVRRGEPILAPDQLENLARSMHSRTLVLRPWGPRTVETVVARTLGAGTVPAFARACYRPSAASQLAALCDISDTAADDALGACASALLMSTSDWTFLHPFVRQSIYTAIPRPERERWHDAAARVLRDNGDLAVVAGHIELGTRSLDPRTSAVSAQVGRHAVAADRADLAVGCFTAAAAQCPSPARRTSLELELGRLLRRRGDRAGTHVLERVVHHGDDIERKTAADLLTHIRARTGEPLIERDDASPELVAAVLALSAAPGYDTSAPVALARAGVDRSAAIAAALEVTAEPSRDGPAAGTIGAVLALLDAEDLTSADAVLAAWSAQATSDVDLFTLQARAALRRGRVTVAVAHASAASALINDGAAPPLGHTLALLEAECAVLTGEPSSPTPPNPLAVAADPVSGVELAVASTLSSSAVSSADAIAQLRQSGALARTLGIDNPVALPWRLHTLRLMIEAGGHPYGATLADEQLLAAHTWGSPSAVAAALLQQAALLPHDQRAGLLEQAAAVAETGTNELVGALIRLADGEVLLRTGKTERARVKLAEALDEAGRLGASRVADAAFRLVQEAGARPRRRRRTGVEGLTERELEIAQLAAAGQSNRDIAEKLYLTQRTVELHLTKAFRKLGVTGRQQLAGKLPDRPVQPG